MLNLLKASLFLSLILTGGIFGFFLAWVCSTMWGLDNTEPQIAITAMQAMNASVRNAVFMPFFFGPAPVLILTSVLAFITQNKRAAISLLAAGLIYLIGGNFLTFSVNMPMNEELADIAAANTSTDLQMIWDTYSEKWQTWNQIRTVFSGLSLGLVGFAMMDIKK